MGIQVKLLVISSFLLFFTLSFCQAKNSTVKVVGILHSKDSIKNQSINSNSTLGIDVFIICNNAKTQGNGGIDKHGKFNVTLSADIGEDDGEIDGCYAKLQSNSGAPCHIQEPQAASVKVLTNSENENEAVIIDNNNPTVIEFSPLDCQSAFFWPFPNLTFLGSPPSPPEYVAPPTPEDLPPAPSPVQQPLPPPPQPSYDPPAPALPPSEIEAPSPPPSGIPPPAPAPTYQDPIKSSSPPPAAVTSPTSPPPQAPPPQPIYRNPSPTLLPPPSPALPSPPLPTPPSATIPSRRRPSPIPKAPPIPRLPLTPSVPRKYFNPPNSSKSKPPQLV